MTLKEIIARIQSDMTEKKIKVVNQDGYRYYTDTLTEQIIVPLTTAEETAKLYYKLIIDPVVTATSNTFNTLPRVSMFIGQPDTGKTYKAQEIAQEYNIKPIFLMCRDNLNLETLLEDFILVDGKPQFKESLAIKAMSGTDNAIIILDEFNTLLTGVMKTFQPIFDETSSTFVYRGKEYTKNLNCKFIVTLNNKDKGISIIPDAILSRCYVKWFEPVSTITLSNWTGLDINWVNNIYQIYKLLGALNIFGSRQLRIIKNLSNVTEIKNHLYGISIMKNIDSAVLDTLPMQNLINKL